MKKLCIIAVLTLICAVCLGFSTTALAETVAEPETSTETIVDENNNSTSASEENSDMDTIVEDLTEKLTIALNKIAELTGADNFFNTKILPGLIGAAVTLIVGAIVFVLPFVKNKKIRAQLEGFVSALQTKCTELQNQLNSVDPANLRKMWVEEFENDLKLMMKEFKSEYGSYFKTFVTLKTTIETTYSQMVNLIDAARQAWASKPEVAALLAESPEKSTLEKQVAENEALKNYIRSVKGEEAESIIKGLEAV